MNFEGYGKQTRPRRKLGALRLLVALGSGSACALDEHASGTTPHFGKRIGFRNCQPHTAQDASAHVLLGVLCREACNIAIEEGLKGSVSRILVR